MENERNLEGLKAAEENGKLDSSFLNPLLFLIFKSVRMYDNYLHLVKIITLSEKSQAGE